MFLENGPLGRPFTKIAERSRPFFAPGRFERTACVMGDTPMNVDILCQIWPICLTRTFPGGGSIRSRVGTQPSNWREGVEERTREYSLQILDEDSPLSRVDIKFETDSGLSHPPEASKTAAFEG